MGAESFDVQLESPLTLEGLSAILVGQGLRLNFDPSRHVDELHYVYEDDSHLIEFELSRVRRGTRLAARFALCQSQTIDEAFVKLVTTIAKAGGARLAIKSEVSDRDGETFASTRLEGAASAILRAAGEKRAAWIRDFTVRDTKASCEEAVRRFLLTR